MIRSALILLIVLAGFWLMLSGYLHKPVLLIMGALSVSLVLGLAVRMKILDDETVPYFHGKALGYYVWLFIEILKANMAVVRAVLSPDMEISSTTTTVPMKQSTDLGACDICQFNHIDPLARLQWKCVKVLFLCIHSWRK